MQKVKEYKINEAVLITYHTLNALYQQFSSIYPTKLGSEIVDLICKLKDNLDLKQNKD